MVQNVKYYINIFIVNIYYKRYKILYYNRKNQIYLIDMQKGKVKNFYHR